MSDFIAQILVLFLGNYYELCWSHQASLVAQMGKHLPTMWETQVRSLGWEDPLEKEMATHPSTLAWRIPCGEEPGRLQSTGSQRVGHDFTFTFIMFLERNKVNGFVPSRIFIMLL